eukprot:gene34971-41133_t
MIAPIPENSILGLYGAGGCARAIMPFIAAAQLQGETQALPRPERIFFVETNPLTDRINGVPLISEKSFFELDCEQRFFNVAIANSQARERLAVRCMSGGAIPLFIRAPTAIIYGPNEIGVGAIICDNCMITSNCKIGKFFHMNIYSYVEHDCVIGDFVTFAPNVHCNGNIHVHDHAYIGAGAILKQGISTKPLIIGEGAIVGMGAVVTKDVPAYTTVVGNPASYA